MQDISKKLIEWFKYSQRVLPWRDNPEPYRVWVSEIMLQQTRVQAVIPYYNTFISILPDVQTLADASLEEVLNVWKGLGYYARAKNLYLAAQVIRDQYSGKFPDSYDQVLKLPGIGKYTAAAILSIAFGQPYPVIDGNVLRVMSRLYNISTDIRLPATARSIESILTKIFPASQASAFNQGMMELGALICIPNRPRCNECPLTSLCLAFMNSNQEELPFVSAKPKPVIIKRIVLVVRYNDRLLIHLRSSKGLLASMWEFPGVDGSIKDAGELFQKEYRFSVQIGKKLFDAEHVFTHRHWKMKVYEGTIEAGYRLDENIFKWVEVGELENYPIPKAFKSIMEYCGKTVK